MHPKILRRGKVSTCIDGSKNAAWGREGMRSAGRICDQWRMLRKGVCLQLCLCPEQRHWLKDKAVCLHDTSSFFFHSGTNQLHPDTMNGSLLPLKRQEEKLSSNAGLVKEFVQAMKNAVSFLSLRV